MKQLDDITQQLLDSGMSYKDIQEMDGQAFLSYLERRAESKSAPTTELISGAEFFNRF
ncbi:hypothetical protein [Lactiplantibacillus mudanjiangensis]|uniref:hypothetical protein n=1 Tax=Lactiplantibacillus mudanjiangensis TaxID=1296538 RepID=UPI0013EEEFEC